MTDPNFNEFLDNFEDDQTFSTYMGEEKLFEFLITQYPQEELKHLNKRLTEWCGLDVKAQYAASMDAYKNGSTQRRGEKRREKRQIAASTQESLF